MINKSWLIIPATLLLAGCATYDKEIADLNSRVQVLESKTGVRSGQRQATIISTVTSEAATAAKETAAPELPTKKDIQSCLKTAGFYVGDVDGKMGPKTKKAIEDFQAANDLMVDGRVGTNTWTKLKKYYTAPETTEKTETTAVKTME